MRLAPFRPTGAGAVKAVLLPAELRALRRLPEMLRPVIEADLSGIDAMPAAAADPDATDSTTEHERLFPVASRDDPKVAAAFRAVAQDELVKAKLQAIDRFESMVTEADALRPSGKWITHLTADEATTWLMVLNDSRLVLGIRLGVTEEMYDDLPDELAGDPDHQLYWMLSELLHWLVESASIAAGRGSTTVTREDLEKYED